MEKCPELRLSLNTAKPLTDRISSNEFLIALYSPVDRTHSRKKINGQVEQKNLFILYPDLPKPLQRSGVRVS